MSGPKAQAKPAPKTVYDRTDFPSAVAKYAALVAATGCTVPRSQATRCHGTTRRMHGATEITVFGIDPHLPRPLF